jgi:hypothetical protein
MEKALPELRSGAELKENSMPWLEFFTGKKAGKREEVTPEAAALAVSIGIAEEVLPPVPVYHAAPVWEVRFNRLSEKIHLHLHCDRCACDTNFDGGSTPEYRQMLNGMRCAHSPEIPDATWSEYAARYTGTLSLGISFAQPQPFRIDPVTGERVTVKG